ncbi:hypothetical protein CCR85_02290 [Rhodothalassium salexigens]|uniref:methyl-accepting chemotaxis protein n=1 Tax=Rhodothalassium salexigens TaxID=1086 RepID=UPI00191259B9|nr:HAMP domain-containing methyl-accepting chemotaxis protein [Rhodothalassium salexigens]MBK5910319.1 hypothetical protein [Rhodothalassium salexigens]MBK5921068.1 hypothetical protein [Rhodothalassium salexigens]
MQSSPNHRFFNAIRDLPIGRKLAGAFTLGLIITLALGGIGLIALNSVSDRTDKAGEANQLVILALDLHSSEMSYRLDRAPEKAAQVHSLTDRLSDQIQIAAGMFDDAGARTELDSLSAVVGQYKTLFDRFVRIDDQAQSAQTAMEDAAWRVDAELTAFRAELKAQANELIAEDADTAIIQDDLAKADAANRLITYMLDIRRDEKNYQISGDKDAVERVINLVGALRGETQYLLDTAKTGEIRGVAETVLTALDDYEQAFRAFVDGRDRQAEIAPDLSAQAERVEQAARTLREQQTSALIRDSRRAWITMSVFLALSVIGALVLSRTLTKAIAGPLINIAGAMKSLADGKLDIDIPGVGRHDELGQMAGNVQVFKDNAIAKQELEAEQARAEAEKREEEAERRRQQERLEAEQRDQERRLEAEKRQAVQDLADRFESEVGNVVNSVSQSGSSLQATAHQLTTAVQETSEQTHAASQGADQASASVETVASAAEELSAAIREVNEQVSQAARNLQNTAKGANEAGSLMDDLQGAVSQIDEVVGQIGTVAEQTNLLALNATIEAARAGDAGKGFAVVAGEVKQLASQTQKMTESIASQLAAVNEASNKAVNATRTIVTEIDEVNASTGSMAAAIEQQASAVDEISRSAQEAAMGTSEVTQNLTSLRQAAENTSQASNSVSDSADGLARDADTLRATVKDFLSGVRAS